MTDPLHVAPGIVGFLDAPNHLRIRAIRTERWIGFGRARRVVEHLSALWRISAVNAPTRARYLRA